jgi:uncharacterized protein YbaR (Trm112 family)
MPAKPSKPIQLDPTIVSQLACPACRGTLRLNGEGLQCESCSRVYPIVDGIPVLIAERGIEAGN